MAICSRNSVLLPCLENTSCETNSVLEQRGTFVVGNYDPKPACQPGPGRRHGECVSDAGVRVLCGDMCQAPRLLAELGPVAPDWGRRGCIVINVGGAQMALLLPPGWGLGPDGC